MNKIHYITFATGINRINSLPYEDTQKLLVNSIQDHTKREVIFHTHNLETIKNFYWWDIIKEYPEKFPSRFNRDGYYNAAKVFLASDLIDKIDDEDFIYYTDSSTYFVEPFSQNIDRLFDFAEHHGHVCGSVGNDFKHNSFACCNNPKVWKVIWPQIIPTFSDMVLRPHILTSWYVFQKNDMSIKFVKEWAHYFSYELDGAPLCSYHHTVDQSIFNILAYKYGMKVFFNDKEHDHNKNHNNVHRQLNEDLDGGIDSISKWFLDTNNLL